MSEGTEIIAGAEAAVMLSLVADPQAALADAGRAAGALKAVIDRWAPIKFGDREHLRIEHWTTIGKFYGVAARVISTEYVEYGDGQGKVRGWKAKAETRHVATGKLVSMAEAVCLTDEDKWRMRSVYGEVNGKRQIVGEAPVPLYALSSMAQTRACAKALRLPFSWVVVLAGYAPTPAEEMDDDVVATEGKTTVVKTPQPKAAGEATKAPAKTGKISEAQGKRMWAIAKGKGWKNADIEKVLRDSGYESTLDIPRDKYDEAVKFFEEVKPVVVPAPEKESA